LIIFGVHKNLPTKKYHKVIEKAILNGDFIKNKKARGGKEFQFCYFLLLIEIFLSCNCQLQYSSQA